MSEFWWHLGGGFLACMMLGGMIGIAQAAPVPWLIFSAVMAWGFAARY